MFAAAYVELVSGAIDVASFIARPRSGFSGPPGPQDEVVVAGYGYEAINYEHFATQGPCRARTLLYTHDGDVIAAEREEGRGTVLFVNLPLGYLKTRTDGLLSVSSIIPPWTGSSSTQTS